MRAASQVKTLEMRYRSGLQQIFSAEEQVGVMKEELIALQPVLKQTAQETEEMLVVIDRETIEANAKKEVVQTEEAAANVKAAAAKAIKVQRWAWALCRKLCTSRAKRHC